MAVVICSVVALIPPLVSAKATSMIHLTTTGVPTEMAVSWSEQGKFPHGTHSLVRYGLSMNQLSNTAIEKAATIMVSMTENMTGYDYCSHHFETHTLHVVHLTDLPPDTDVFYSVDVFNNATTKAEERGLSGPLALAPYPSPVASFHTPPLEPASTLRFLATADMGDPVAHPWTAIPQMIEECGLSANSSDHFPIELGLHVGDIACTSVVLLWCYYIVLLYDGATCMQYVHVVLNNTRLIQNHYALHSSL